MNNTLFRFATHRNYQRISQADKEEYYVIADKKLVGQLHYINGLKSGTYSEIIKQIKDKPAYGNLKSINELRSYKNGKIYILSLELENNRISPNFEYIKSLNIKKDPDSFTEKQELILWDNLIHALFIEKSKPKVDSIISLLVANNFLRKFNRAYSYSDPTKHIDERKKLKRIINAKIVIPTNITIPQRKSSENQLSTAQKTVLLDKQNLILSNHQIKLMDLLKKDALKLSISGALDAKISDKLTKLNAAKTANFLKDISKSVQGLPADSKRIILADMGKRVTEITSLESVKLTKDEIVEEWPSEQNKDALKKLNLSFTNLSSLRTSISQNITSTLQRTYKTRTIFASRAIVNGVRIDIKPIPVNNSFIISTKPNDDKYDIYLTQYFNNEETAIVEIKGKIILGPNTSVELNGEKLHSDFNNFVTFKLNVNPFKFPNRTQSDIVELTYRTSMNLFDDVNETISKIRLSYPYYGILKISPNQTVKPDRTPLYGVTNLGISDFRRVDQEVVCYVKGEVSHIENIMASEYKEKTSRSFISTELTEESESIFETETVSDTSTTDRFEMQSELSEVLSSESSKDFSLGTGVSGTYPSGISFSVDADANFSSSNSKEESNSLAINQAREITEQVKDRIFSKVIRKRTYRMRREFEETNKHGYDNRLNKEHVVGIYRWVDKIYENKLVNYGRRLMYEFMIAEPGRNFMDSLTIESDVGNQTSSESNIIVTQLPKHPDEIFGANSSYDSLTEEQIYHAAAIYGANLDELPNETVSVSRAFSMVMRESGAEYKTDDSQAFNELEIPEGYICIKVRCRGMASVHGDSDEGRTAHVYVGTMAFPVEFFDKTRNTFKGEHSEFKSIEHTERTLGVTFITNDIGSFGFTVTAKCERKESVFNQWRLDSYNAIFKAYEEKLAAFNEQTRANIAETFDPIEPEQREYNYNPAINRKIESIELKRLCIEMLTKPFEEITISADNYKYADGKPSLKLDSDYEIRAIRASFLEQAFEWDIMAYKFFPYFYAPKNRWYTLMHMEGTTDEVFKSFLSSGMAKVKLPVRRGYENAVQYFLNTGEIWLGSGFVLDVDEDMHISINEEMDTGNEEIIVEETWETKVPTTLTIVQDDGKALESEGLPCGQSSSIVAKGKSVLIGVENKTP
ncbi:MAG: hypothetical protein H6657_21945 [Ardenticatenaceae bacterium]|nr:hypothetical protein [Ardenticatenaceae bacterium]